MTTLQQEPRQFELDNQLRAIENALHGINESNQNKKEDEESSKLMENSPKLTEELKEEEAAKERAAVVDAVYHGKSTLEETKVNEGSPSRKNHTTLYMSQGPFYNAQE
mmetsp:Transcript_23030/g.22385  ORF Transcript_23030/g.22385 Transcript_23030/m.22385 type:complete len:108 (-) Transcript_23030:3729-4052(-)